MGFLKFLKRDKGNEPDLGLENVEDLDMPPPPPEAGEKDFGSVEKGLPKLPDMDAPSLPSDFGEPGLKGSIKDELPELPELPEMPEADEPISETEKKLVPELDVPSEKPSPELELPSIGSPEPQGRLEEPKVPRVPRPLFGVQKPIPLFGIPQQERPRPKVEMSQPEQIEVPRGYAPKIKPYERLERAAVREERAVLRHKEAKEPIFIRVDRFKNILIGTGTIKNNLKTASQSIIKLNEIDADRDKILEKWSNVMGDIQKKLIFIDKTLFKR